ncbi:MAG: hypothetical protein FJ011_08220 [Chloroflexi bacterium]|nr:hypothetical protein [Chloroflexota bacterium]
MPRAAYRFFDAPFVVETDSAAFLAQFDAAYERFRAEEEAGAPVYRVTLAGRPAAEIEGETWRSTDAEALSTYAYNALLNAATARVCSHFLFHAAAVIAPAGSGVILAAGAGLGKTTLTVALLQRGYAFLSDDVAAVGRTDGRLYPFPRRLGVRVTGGRPGEKRLLDVTEIAPGSLSGSAGSGCPARFLFLLTDASEPATNFRYLVLDRADEGLLADLRAVSGVQAVHAAQSQPYPVLWVDLARGAWPTSEPAIQALCRRREVLLFEATAGPAAPPDFSVRPELTRLAATGAAQALLGHLKGGPRSALLDQVFGGSATRLYLALVGLADRMVCYRLRVGRLDGMIETIMATTSELEKLSAHVPS